MRGVSSLLRSRNMHKWPFIVMHAAGKRTVGVKVNVDNTEIYVFP